MAHTEVQTVRGQRVAKANNHHATGPKDSDDEPPLLGIPPIIKYRGICLLDAYTTRPSPLPDKDVALECLAGTADLRPVNGESRKIKSGPLLKARLCFRNRARFSTIDPVVLHSWERGWSSGWLARRAFCFGIGAESSSLFGVGFTLNFLDACEESKLL